MQTTTINWLFVSLFVQIMCFPNPYLVSFLKGKLEAEFVLLTEEQAAQNPAGLGREEPNALPEPK
jgi:hypothetical protein